MWFKQKTEVEKARLRLENRLKWLIENGYSENTAKKILNYDEESAKITKKYD